MGKGVFIVVSGPSGAGKSTIIRELIAKDSKLKFSISVTTRAKRRGEKEGVHYFFVTKEKFGQMIEKDEFLEWAQFQENFYGTPQKFIKDNLNAGFDCILDIDVVGASQVMKKMKDGVYIFVAPKNVSVLKKRLHNRKTENEGVINKRIVIAHKEMRYIDKYEYFVINDDLAETVDKVGAIISAERSKTFRNFKTIKQLRCAI